MNSDTPMAGVLDDRELERLEADFLRCDSRLGTAFLPRVDSLELDVSLSTGDEEVMRLSRYRTRWGCCG